MYVYYERFIMVKKKSVKKIKYTVTGGGLKAKSTSSKLLAKKTINARIKKILSKVGKKKISIRVARVS